MKPFALVLCVLVILPASAEKQAFERYQPIVDRQMFGPLPPDFDPNKSPSEVQKSSSAQEKELSKEQEQLKSAVHFSVLDVRPNGEVLVGFTDNTDPKVPRNYFLKVGESRDGWTVKEADADAATMTIVKGEIEVSLTLGGNSAKGAGTTSRAGGVPAETGRKSSSLGASLSSRRFQRRQAQAEEQAKAEAAAKAAAAREEERQQQAEAEKAQREAERAEQRQQLQQIQEELKRAREARAAAESAKAEPNGGAESGGAEN